jgi:hypothetical protein
MALRLQSALDDFSSTAFGNESRRGENAPLAGCVPSPPRGPLRLRSGQAFDCVRLAPHSAQDDKVWVSLSFVRTTRSLVFLEQPVSSLRSGFRWRTPHFDFAQDHARLHTRSFTSFGMTICNLDG